MDHSSTSNIKNRTKQNENGTIGKKETRTELLEKKRNKNRMIWIKGTRTEQSSWTEQIQKSQIVPSPSFGKDSIPLDKKPKITVFTQI